MENPHKKQNLMISPKTFVGTEILDGKAVNVVDGMKFYEELLDLSEVSKLVSLVNDLRVAGKRGQFQGATFTCSFRLLTWEDGFYDHPKLRLSMESILDDMCFDGSNEIFSCSWRSSRHDGHSGEYPVVQAVASMAGVQYRWGEGVVGEVAYTGSHYWVCENMSAGEFKSKVVPECPDEWLLQFAAGIKTIALIPVVPHGVLQLGTLEEVAEDLALVSYIREKFNAYQNGMDLTPFAGMEFLVQTSSSLVPTFMDNLDESSATTVNQMKSEDPKIWHWFTLWFVD
ncbi:Transcription factor LHW [Camellia lanceoleosa]|uniref:Transcription factor LHW n=1 Tax=Camellia lanceoleosa TaxID=1840588 RepID=A0ACC0FDR2_9ERIC|nr:Transcription factor LHW [Camellia lanceoleosa]